MVHDRTEILDQLTASLRLAGYDVAAFSDPMAALEALEASERPKMLITGVEFGPGKLHGIGLARMARRKRAKLQILFVGHPDFVEYAEGVGKYMALPVSIPEIVDVVRDLLEFGQPNLIHQPTDKAADPEGAAL